MSDTDFVKSACHQCGGHIEFAAGSAGQTVNCPHCGQPMELIPLAAPYNKKMPWGLWLGIFGAVCLMAVAGMYLYLSKVRTSVNSPALQPVPPTPTNAIMAQPGPVPEVETNDFAVFSFTLEKTQGSSLVYIVGTLHNASERERFGVKIAFNLLDANDAPVGTATDYRQVLPPNSDWYFKALVIESKAASASFAWIKEEK